ncbi:hypothetical protein [Marinobacterium sp. BA1]|uniref:hypothetical protein n=1 Tax=Marinobacterium sp. BA1 TaxID=3138931 RepID=UPI0032E77E53
MSDDEYREFRRGILFALCRLPIYGGAFEDIVTQAGGFDELLEVANPEERALLVEARSLMLDED